jgi:hypothetical protein
MSADDKIECSDLSAKLAIFVEILHDDLLHNLEPVPLLGQN